MKKILFVLLVVLFGFKQTDNKLIWQEVWKSRNSGIYKTSTRLITDTSDLHRLITDVKKKDYTVKIEDNEVDFNNQSLLVYFAGEDVNDIKMDSIIMNNNKLLVYIDRIEFSRGCYEAALLVSPYLVLKINKGSWKDYEIRTFVTTRICDEH
jgi:hypothetical protein